MVIFFVFSCRDLRGNHFQCECQSMWLMLWLKKTNATVSDVYCAEPEEMKGILLKDFPEKHAKCVSTGNCIYNHCTVQRIQCVYNILLYKLQSFIGNTRTHVHSRDAGIQPADRVAAEPCMKSYRERRLMFTSNVRIMGKISVALTVAWSNGNCRSPEILPRSSL